MREGDFVRHRTRPDWGIGVVRLAPNNDTWLVEFESRGLVKLAAGFTAQLEHVPDESLPAIHPLRGNVKKVKAKGAATKRRVKAKPVEDVPTPTEA